MPRSSWKSSRDPLYRGDTREDISRPDPRADPSIVRHVLYLDGAGRTTPYLSTTEERATAERFAGKSGHVYITSVPAWQKEDVNHRSRSELAQLLRGRGKGDARWPSAFEVMQARRYVEENAEHLADFRPHAELSPEDLAELVERLFD